MTDREVVLALGANADAEENMRQAQRLLKDLVDGLRCSTPVWTEPIGIKSGPFLNCVATGVSHRAYQELYTRMKAIERACGNSASRRRRGEIAMDIDILLYGDRRYHPGDWERAYIQEGMKELFS